jgi:diguanylate cyclase (GGDEF)-like protein
LDDDGYLTFAASRGFTPEYTKNFKLKLEKSFLYCDTGGNITGARLISKKTIDRTGTVFRPEDWRYRSVISAPMFANKRLFGLLNLDSENVRTFLPEDVHIVEQFTAQIEVCLLARGRYRHHIERAQVDALTGLHTRRYFEELFAIELARAERYGETFILALFDADGLKKVNDAFGHQAGDRMLVAIADALRTGHRKTDVIGRFGGDEFIAVYHATETLSMEKNLSAVLAGVEASKVAFEGNRIPVAFSFGLACFPTDGKTMDELIAVADRNLYAMKKLRKANSGY